MAEEPERDLVRTLVERLAPLPSERAVISALLSQEDHGWVLSHASLLIGPAAMAKMSWSDWARRELAPEAGLAREGMSPEFILLSDGLLAARQVATVRRATGWLRHALAEKTTPRLGGLPEATTALHEPRAPLLARPYNDTPASAFVLRTVRPVTGFFFRASSAVDATAPDLWRSEDEEVRLATLLGIDAPTDVDRTTSEPAPAGVLLGRLSRRAWIARVSYRREEELLHVWLRLEGARADPHELEVEVREYIDGDLADCRRLRLADVPLPARVRGRLGLEAGDPRPRHSEDCQPLSPRW